MKIAIDARELEGQRTGVGRYLHELLCAWSRATRPDHEFVLCSRERVDIAAYGPLRVGTAIQPGHGLLWEQLSLPRMLKRENVDLLFAPGYTAPLVTSTPCVLVVHDVSFCAHPEWFSWREGARRRTVTRLAARRAKRVVTVSQFSKVEIERQLGVEPQRIVVVPNGVTRMAAPVTSAAREPVVLFVGSIFNRRHVDLLIDAVAVVARLDPTVRLEIVGENRTNPRIDLAAHAKAAGIDERVQVRSYVSDQELQGCYSRASAFAFLSEYEGFGLTPLEALSAGVPSVVLDGPTTREVYGEGAFFVPELSVSAVAQTLTRALGDPGERARVLRDGLANLQKYSWETAAARLLAIFDEIVAHDRAINGSR